MDYARAVQLAQRLIEKNGRAVTLQTLSSVAVDANKPWKGAGTPTVAASFERIAVFVPHTGLEELGKYLVDDQLLKKCEEVAMIAGGPDDLSLCNQLQDDGKSWRIMWTRVLKPGDTSVLYVVGLYQ